MVAKGGDLMIAQLFIALYLAGVLCAVAEYRKPGRHRAGRLSTLEQTMSTESWLAATRPMYPPVGRYEHKAGVGRYAHLRTEELDTTNDRMLKLRERRLGPAPEVDLQALRVRGAVPTVGEIDDEWFVDLAPVGAR